MKLPCVASNGLVAIIPSTSLAELEIITVPGSVSQMCWIGGKGEGKMTSLVVNVCQVATAILTAEVGIALPHPIDTHNLVCEKALRGIQ